METALMKITNVETIEFRTTTRLKRSRWIGIEIVDETEITQSITVIDTDEGLQGYILGGNKSVNDHVILPTTPGLGMEFDWDYINDDRVL